MHSEYQKNKSQSWAKNWLFFLLYELLHQQICSFQSYLHWHVVKQGISKTVTAILFFSSIFWIIMSTTVLIETINVETKTNSPIWWRYYPININLFVGSYMAVSIKSLNFTSETVYEINRGNQHSKKYL